MKEDIERPKVENVEITNVLVTSKGYGNLKGEKKKTTTLRHFIEEVQPLDFKLIEPIMPEVFELNNEYWLSYYLEGVIHDKKYVFVKGSIVEENMIDLPFINARGVLIR